MAAKPMTFKYIAPQAFQTKGLTPAFNKDTGEGSITVLPLHRGSKRMRTATVGYLTLESPTGQVTYELLVNSSGTGVICRPYHDDTQDDDEAATEGEITP